MKRKLRNLSILALTLGALGFSNVEYANERQEDLAVGSTITAEEIFIIKSLFLKTLLIKCIMMHLEKALSLYKTIADKLIEQYMKMVYVCKYFQQ